MKRVWLWAALAAASWAGCGDPNVTGVTQLNLDRPVDISFACYGAMRQTDGQAPAAADPVIPTAQPLEACASLSPLVTSFGVDGKPVAPPPAPGQETLTGSNNGNPIVPDWYAFILQSASGTVALAKWPTKPADVIGSGISDTGGDFEVLDADPLTPGKNAIAIGEDPVAIATDKAGCFELTANAGSCDLSELEINSALDDIPPVPGKATTPVRVDRKPVTNAMGGVILAKPAAMVAEPGSNAVGFACPATATGRVYIAYPSCHLVAGVDTATGKIVAGIRYDATGAPTILSGAALDGVSCPAECTGDAGTAAAGSIMPGPQPVALDLRQDTRVGSVKLVIGTKNSVSPGANLAAPLTVVDLDPVTSDPKSPALQIALEDPTAESGKVTRLGVTSVALSPQIGMGGNASVTDEPVSDENTPGGQGQFIYAVATDGTVRVADVLGSPRECDTQIDGRFLRDASITDLQCLAPRDPAKPRRSGARGPGIELPGDAVPTSVAIIKGRNGPVPTRDMTTGMVTGSQPLVPTTPLGYFAIVTASSGVSYVVNIDDDGAPDKFSLSSPLASAPVLVMAHQLRDSFTNREQGLEGAKTDPTTMKPSPTTVPTCQITQVDPPGPKGGALAGGPRVSTVPAQNIPAGTLKLDAVLPLPTIQQVECTGGMADADFTDKGEPKRTAASTLQLNAPEPARDLVFPDLRSVVSETWTLTWQGTLSLDNITTAVDGPVVRSGQIAVDGYGMTLKDPAQPFCDMGVEPFDIVDLRGCNPANNDGDCPAGYTCYVHPKSQGIGVGACMLKSEAPRLANACFQFLTTLRRYTVGTTRTGDLTLLERKHELAMTPIDGCVDDNQCNQLAQDALKIDPTADPFTPKTHWACQTDPLRARINADDARNKRCVQTCSTDKANPVDCATGTVCRLLNPSGPNATDGICMEGVEPPQECVRGPQRYDVRASEAFTVIGSRSGYVHPIIKDPNSAACVRDPKVKDANNVQIGRIPINPISVPACDPTATAATGQLPGGGFDANPCSLMAPQFDTIQPIGMPVCTAARKVGDLGVRNAQAIRFRNRAMTLTMVDPYQSCLPADMASPATVPLMNRDYQLEFAQKAGFAPLQVPLIAPTYPVKVVRGPSESFWVIDDGDFLSTSITQASTRGRVFRVEGVDLNVANILQ